MSAWAALRQCCRRRDWLKRTAVTIVAAGFALALVRVALAPDAQRAVSLDAVEQARRNEWQRLLRAPAAQPRAAVHWLLRVTQNLEHLSAVLGLEPTTWDSFRRDGLLAGYDAAAVFAHHAPEAELRRLWETYLEARLADSPQAARRLQEWAEGATPPSTANELLAGLRLHAGDVRGALEALQRELGLSPAVPELREGALRLALRLKDRDAVRALVDGRPEAVELPPLLEHHAGVLLHHPWLQWRGLLRHRLLHVPYASLGLAFLAAALWYSIFVLQGAGGRWRWAWPILPVMAGVLSVQPVLVAGAWQESALGLSDQAAFPGDLWFYVAGVGLREEAGKLALAALFLPWLLRRREPGLALMTGAFVGLGFALEENINYYEEFGGAVALVRFFTANFLHAALTGLACQALYQLVRSRFASAERFLATFFGVVAVHGLYNYAATLELEGVDFLSMAVLAAAAWRFLDRLEEEIPPRRAPVPAAAVFLLGTAVLIACILVGSVWQEADRQRLADAAMECLAVLPLAFIYWRRLEHELV